jgi:N-acetylmuramoyl-L-alanine amidase
MALIEHLAQPCHQSRRTNPASAAQGARTEDAPSRLCSAAIQTLLAAVCLAAPAFTQQPPPPLPPIAPGKPDLPPLPQQPGNQPSIQAAFSVLIDAAHGGADTGARIGEHLLEKDLTLGFSIRLRSALAARGIAVVTTRESDINPAPNERAGIANHALASACLVIHATATGTGVHLYTSSLAPSTAPQPAILPWQTAQFAWITRSLRLSSEIDSTLGQAGIPVTLGRTYLQPLDNLTCPAVAIEIAPLAASPANKATPLSDPKYQQRLLDALAAAILEWSAEWKEQP